MYSLKTNVYVQGCALPDGLVDVSVESRGWGRGWVVGIIADVAVEVVGGWVAVVLHRVNLDISALTVALQRSVHKFVPASARARKQAQAYAYAQSERGLRTEPAPPRPPATS